MQKKVLLLLSVSGLLIVRQPALANDIEPGKEFYTATRAAGPLTNIVIDGNLSEWVGVTVLADPKFAICPGCEGVVACSKGCSTNGNYVLFERYQGGDWTGPDDQTSAVQVVWDDDNVYFGFVVTDEYHENAANSAWNGDSIQLMVANATRDTQIARYNYALGGVEGATNGVIINHELGPAADQACNCPTEAVVRRDAAAKKTIYEIKLPTASIGLTSPLTAGTQFGLGMAINDGDRLTPGQKGWGGLGAHSIVFGKNAAETALVTLGTNLPTTDRIFLSAINGGFTTFTFRATDKGASIVDPASAKLILDSQSVRPTPGLKTGDATDFTYTYPTRLTPGTSHNYSIEIKDTLGNTVTASGIFNLPNPRFPPQNLPSLPVVNKAWRIRQIFGAGTIDGIPASLAAIQAVGTPAFTGVSVDYTNAVINYGNGGLFANPVTYADPVGGTTIFYPPEVVNDPSGLWAGDDFIQFSVGNIEILAEGDYTFGVHSDDGFALRIRGGEAISVNGNGQLDPADPEAVVHPANTGDSSTRAVYRLKKGVYRTEFFWWDRAGGDNGELYAAKGAFTTDDSTDQWRLVGDNAPWQQYFKLGVDTNGWTVISSDVGGDPLNTWADAFADLAATGGNPTNYDRLDLVDPETNAGTLAFPKNTSADDNDYALKANAKLVVPAAGTYVIGFNSDDGAYIKIPGQSFTEILANATGLSVIQDPETVICDCLTGDSGTTASITLAQGTYPIEAGMFERGGGSFFRVRGGQLGSPQFAVLTKNAAGSFTTPDAIHLTNAPTGVVSDLRATITRSGNIITISWTPTGGTLEFTSALGGTPTWATVGTNNPAAITPPTTGNGYYRVKQ